MIDEELVDRTPALTYRSGRLVEVPQTIAEMSEYVGRRVRVTYGDHEEIEGLLIAINFEGEFVIDTGRDGRRYGWPALRVRPLTTQPGDRPGA